MTIPLEVGISKLLGDVLSIDHDIAVTEDVSRAVIDSVLLLEVREQKAIVLHYGLASPSLKLASLGRELQDAKTGQRAISGAQAGQIVRRGIRKLRHPVRIKATIQALRASAILGQSTVLTRDGRRIVLEPYIRHMY